jgi:hypothetical protein
MLPPQVRLDFDITHLVEKHINGSVNVFGRGIQEKLIKYFEAKV